MKKLVALLMTLLLVISLATVVASAESEEEQTTYHFKFSIPQVEGDPAYVSAEKFIAMVEEETGGNITFDFYPARNTDRRRLDGKCGKRLCCHQSLYCYRSC